MVERRLSRRPWQNGQEEWVNKWEELTGIELEVIQPDHSAYYDVLGQTLASGPENWPDVSYPWNLPIIPDMRERELSGI